MWLIIGFVYEHLDHVANTFIVIEGTIHIMSIVHVKKFGSSRLLMSKKAVEELRDGIG